MMTKEWANAKPRRRRRGVREDSADGDSLQTEVIDEPTIEE
jgi:hypothetical protein